MARLGSGLQWDRRSGDSVKKRACNTSLFEHSLDLANMPPPPPPPAPGRRLSVPPTAAMGSIDLEAELAAKSKVAKDGTAKKGAMAEVPDDQKQYSEAPKTNEDAFSERISMLACIHVPRIVGKLSCCPCRR